MNNEATRPIQIKLDIYNEATIYFSCLPIYLFLLILNSASQIGKLKKYKCDKILPQYNNENMTMRNADVIYVLPQLKVT